MRVYACMHVFIFVSLKSLRTMYVYTRPHTYDFIGHMTISTLVCIHGNDGVDDSQLSVLRDLQVVEWFHEHGPVVVLVNDLHHDGGGVIQGREGTVLHIGCHQIKTVPLTTHPPSTGFDKGLKFQTNISIRSQYR